MSEDNAADGALTPFAPDEVAEPGVEETQQVLVFEACGERFALPLDVVTEVQPLPPVTRVPTAPAEVIGITNLRGRVLTLFGLGPCLGIPAEAAPATHLIVLDLQDAELTVGLAVERIGDVCRVPRVLDTPPPQEGAPSALASVFEADGQVVGLLDPLGIFTRFLPEWGLAAAPEPPVDRASTPRG